MGVTPTISDEALYARTGKVWAEWFTLLDAAGGEQLSHKQIVAWLKRNSAMSAWWQQMVTVTYEQARGLRDKHEKPDGYQISATKTMHADRTRVFAAWKNARKRKLWLPAEVHITKSTEDVSLRIAWHDGTRVDVELYSLEGGKCRLSVTHGKLPDAETAAAMKAYWKERISVLFAVLSS